jgi:hypothetical protein
MSRNSPPVFLVRVLAAQAQPTMPSSEVVARQGNLSDGPMMILKSPASSVMFRHRSRTAGWVMGPERDF